MMILFEQLHVLTTLRCVCGISAELELWMVVMLVLLLLLGFVLVVQVEREVVLLGRSRQETQRVDER